jgi:SPP1 family predicted phage head-tail adaptor
MRAGRLRNRLEIWRDVPITNEIDEGGHPKVKATRIRRIWADVAPQSGKEYQEAKQQNAELTHLIKVRYESAADLQPTDYLKLGGRRLDVLYRMNVMERDRELQLQCKEVV